MSIERRFAATETAISGKRLSGYAAVYQSITDIGPYYEQLAPTAFRSALAAPDLDVVGLFNHNPDHLLARTANGSLRLSSDSTGLLFDMDIPETTLGQDLRAMVEAGLITGCSFAFTPDDQSWSTHEGRDLRTHQSVKRIHDVSVVTQPAYQATSVALRSKPSDNTVRSQTALARARVHLPRGN